MMLMFCTQRITKYGVSDEISVMEFDDGSSGLCPVAVDDKVHETSLYTTSVCSGSLLLGAAGLLNGLEATTHWNALEFLTNFGAKPVKARVVRQVVKIS
jgi:hypothetical protein